MAPQFNRYNSKLRKDEGGKKNLFLRLDDDHKFEGYALFVPDPDAENNPGYLEYQEHWDGGMNRFVPCWGKENGCIYCLAGVNPSTRAQAAFYVLTTNDGDETTQVNEIKLFRLNWGLLQEWWDAFEEDGSTLGQKVRVKCVKRQSGDYTTKFFEKDRLSEEEVEKHLENVPDIANMIQRSLDTAIETLKLQDALHDEDELVSTPSEIKQAEEEMPKARKGTPVDDEGEPESFTAEFVITSVNSAEATLTVEGLDSDLYMGSVDLVEQLDELTEGDSVVVNYAKDDDEDWVATSITQVPKKSNSKAKAKK